MFFLIWQPTHAFLVSSCAIGRKFKQEASICLQEHANVPVKSKLKHPPPNPPGIPRALDAFSCLGGREFNKLSLPRGGAFDHHS